MRPLPPAYTPFPWAPSTEELARRAGLTPQQILRFDGNVPPSPGPSARPDTVADALARVHTYPHGGYPAIYEAIAAYAGVEPANVVLGAGADDLLLLCARAFAGPGDVVAVAHEPTYPILRLAAWLTGAEVDARVEEPVLTFVCRPNNPSGALVDVPDARPLVVDEAYFEYAGETAVGLLDEGVIVVRTFSKAFALAGARVGYALAAADVAAALRERQAPLPVSTLSVALAVAALANPPDVRPLLAERKRVADVLRGLGLEPLPSHANFVFVPLADPGAVADGLVLRGLVVRPFADGIRITIRGREDDDRLLAALAKLVGSAP
ncbi:MAG: aminotransferase class I/II-fold pyridoxal phosphate-dependent enzyme [Thermoleophilia bacterium]|nr:aminotransferase class I/II-fold pyridoxal phosphate-dependent enzyme [Thermoleophilia bacterium]